MKTIAEKNKVETELRCAPSNIRREKEKSRERKIAKWVTVAVGCAIVGWLVVGIAKEIITVNDLKIHHILTVILVLRWLLVKGVSTLKTIALIILITAISR